MAAALRAGGARRWQVELVAPVLADGLRLRRQPTSPRPQAAAAEAEADAPDVADDTAG